MREGGYIGMAQAAYRTPPEERGLTGRVSEHIEIDWPRSLGFFGALGAAVALDLVPIPIAAFVAAVPFLKLLNRPDAATPQRFIGQVVDGAAKPVGGDTEGTIHWASKTKGPGTKHPRKRVARARDRSSRSAGGAR